MEKAAVIPTLEFWYDFASPYSYIAALRVEQLTSAANVGICRRPFLLGPIFKRRSGGASPFQNPAPSEQRYRRRDVERICQRFDLPLRWPSAYPRGSLLATRIALLAADEGWCSQFTQSVFHANFAEDRSISSEAVVRELLAELGRDADAILAKATSEALKTRLMDQVDAAISQDIFGAPSFVIGGELFWGSDRLDQAIEWATQRPSLI
ncbi:2-hydroxychromene-2-carboxylate isomerase [Variovorax sp. J22R133]|uniref:2-hydroxychromene-2-carboxylate isomerase n=1 Tax=Variovorax brevis TaxID=3053503 RepID=UPI00257689EA|nr:2-hydroxychromene-2-carboxylate isomerase [Variovorax sp. J22R133]MDM0116024.1 2-hydroxychromene-2-carboxylate isomerase [Variovorax sp. J22R133]